MNHGEVTAEGIKGRRAAREATTGVLAGRPSPNGDRPRRADRGVVPDATFTSYYGQPIINPPVWHEPDIPGYLFLGGLAGASSALAAGAHLTGRTGLARAAKSGATIAAGLSLAALVHDLGRPARFLNMLRTFKPTSPMSVGSWLLAGYVPAAAGAALTAMTGRLPRLGVLATAAAASMGPAVATYTAVLVTNTAVPAWHEGWREMPFVFGSSAAAAAGGWALMTAPPAEQGPARRLGAAGALTELALTKRMERRMGLPATAYHHGSPAKLLRAADALNLVGAVGAVTSGGRPWTARGAGLALLMASVCTRFGVFRAGLESARDPAHTVTPQRERRAVTGPDSRGSA